MLRNDAITIRVRLVISKAMRLGISGSLKVYGSESVDNSVGSNIGCQGGALGVSISWRQEASWWLAPWL